jgi:hypothetical protein
MNIENMDEEFESGETKEETPTTRRNFFYANDALKPPPSTASVVDKIKYQQILKSVKRLRRLEKNPLFQVQMMDLKKEIKDESNDS